MERTISSGRGYSRPPIRTYSKRSTSNGSTEPHSKKRRLNDGTENGVGDVEKSSSRSAEHDEQLPKSGQYQLPPSGLPSKQPKKGSILSYFKVTSPSSSTVAPCAQSSELSISSSTSSSSPPPAIHATQRKRRRLTTKPVRQMGSDITSADDSQMAEAGCRTALKTLGTGDAVLLDIGISATNRQTGREANSSDEGKRNTRKRQKSKQATVQTTLSLSLTEKQFVECKDCNMLYNPYHEKDIKLHARQHAALKKKKTTTRGATGNE